MWLWMGRRSKHRDTSKHKAMSYDRMSEAERKLERKWPNCWLRPKQSTRPRIGNTARGGEATRCRRNWPNGKPGWRRFAKPSGRWSRRSQGTGSADRPRPLETRIAERQRQEQHSGQKARGPSPRIPDPEQVKPEPKAQRNFTDPDSRIMKDGATKRALSRPTMPKW